MPIQNSYCRRRFRLTPRLFERLRITDSQCRRLTSAWSTSMRSLPRTLALSIGSLNSLQIAAQEIRSTLELRTTTGQTVFHIGERIALTLTLTGPGNRKYSIDTASYDRSGRLNIDTFDGSLATGCSDPLAQYFRRVPS